eukprot:TRINITY_DN5569_c0_g2_i5.p1 TRINITY_DN5569_c0_g2~~TRINITY_DN5569_c0_g2_i5.p1  ORF type:complete len:292 (+),score=45.84 TRINITY_DN5569_c0_g2_i5:94-969(+)
MKKLFSFGLVADVQYAERPDFEEGGRLRFYRSAIRKFEECVETFNKSQLDFCVSLGDIVDGDRGRPGVALAELDAVLRVGSKLRVPLYHTCGNHDFLHVVDKNTILQKLGLEKSYYSLEREGYLLIFLDTTDISVLAPKDSENFRLASEWLSAHPLAEFPNSEPWNGGISKEQISWLLEQFEHARRSGLKCLIFGHNPIHVLSADERHVMFDNQKILKIFHEHEDVVVAYFNGHYHIGGYTKSNNIHFYGHQGMLEAPEDGNSFSIVHVFMNSLVIEGKGTVENFIMDVKN